MKCLILLMLAICLSAFSLEAKTLYPRQKIYMTGAVKPKSPAAFTVEQLEKFKTPVEIILNDPYNKDTQTTFYGFYLSDLVAAYAQEGIKTVRVDAIDGYKIDIKASDVKSANLFLTYKDNTGYLTVDRMGPARIVAPVKGIVNKDLLLKIGVNWVWQIKTITFIK